MKNHHPNVAFVCSSVSWGGLEMNLLRLAGWIKESKRNVFLFCPINTPLYKEASEMNIKVVPIRIQRKYYDFRAAALLLKQLRQHEIRTVLFSHNRDMSMIATVKWLSRGKINTIYQQQMQLGVDKKDMLHTIRMKYIDAWVSPLHWLKQQTIQKTNIPPQKIHIIPLATDISKWDYTDIHTSESRKNMELPSDAFVIGIIGRLDPHKGQESLIRIMPSIIKEHPKTALLIVGENTKDNKGDYKKLLTDLCIEKGIAEVVHFRPFMKDTRTFFSAIDLFVMATNSETFGMVTTEAMLSNVPVLGSNSGGTPEILENGKVGYLFDPKSETSLLQKLMEILKNPEQSHTIIELAYKSASQRFSHLHATKLYLDLMDDLSE